MSSRPRRSCARGDTSILSPSTIFLWSDTRLRQELTRRGLSRVGIRQDLIDRLLDSINGVVPEEPNNSSGITEENLKESTSADTKAEPNAVEESIVTTTNESDSEPLRKRAKRTTTTKVDLSPKPKPKSAKRSDSCMQPISSNIDRETPGADVASIKETQATPLTVGDTLGKNAKEKRLSKNLTDCRTREPVEPSPTCSIMKPILSILPKVRPVFSPTVVESVPSGCATQGSTSDSSSSVKVPQRVSESSSSASNMSGSDIYDSHSGEDSPSSGKFQGVSKRTSSDSFGSAQGTSQSSRKISAPRVDEERHSSKRLQSSSSATKTERISTPKSITEAWAERFAELKKANTEKYSAGTTLVEKRKVRESDAQKKLVTSKVPIAASGVMSGSTKKSSSTATTSSSVSKADLLDSIMNQQSEFLQTMRKSEERNSPVDHSEIVAKNDRSDVSVGIISSDRRRDMSSAAEEAYKRFELSYADSDSSKSSPKSPQILLPPPPPPPPRKLIMQQKSSKKSSNTVNVDTEQVLVPPPPPPPPPQLLSKDIPPPPPPRRPRVSAIEDLPPPPPPPKRLKPKLPSEKDSPVVREIKRETSTPDENSGEEQCTISADVRTCLEHIVFLVSSIKPFIEISGDLLPSEEVPIPFSQQAAHEPPSSVHDSALQSGGSLKERSDHDSSDKPGCSRSEKVEEVDEEYDPLATLTIEDFEDYVPSAVVSRNVTLEELDSSLNLPELSSMEYEEYSHPPVEQYSPGPHSAPPLDDDVDEGEIVDEMDSASDIQSLSDDSDEDSECEDGEPQKKSIIRKNDSGNFVKILRRTRKENRQLNSTGSLHIGEVNSSAEPQPPQPHPTIDEVEVEEKPDPQLFGNTRHLLQRASVVLQGLREEKGNQYIQIPYDDDYEEEICIQPIDSFHGEPVPDDDELFEVAAGLKPKRKEEVIVEERIPESTEKFEIDFYNGDLHLKGSATDDWVIDPDNQDGLALMWGGVKSTYGILPPYRQGENSVTKETSIGSVVFQIKIIELLPTKHLPFDELDPNDVRVGFSLRSAPLVLGEYPGSYCYTSLGKRAENNIFTDYGDSFGIGDIITAQMDLENGVITFWKNLENMGTAFTNITIPEGEAVYPHICVKNCLVAVNFGAFPGGEEEWKNRPEWIFANSLPRSQTELAPLPPESKSDCTVLMMVGLPSVGKTTWVRRYIREHPNENWTLISADTILAAMKVNGVSRNSSHIGRWDMVLGLVGKARNRLLALAARRRRNYILDFTNCDPDTRKKRLALFEGFFRQCVTIVPSDEVMQQRHARHLRQNRGEGTAAVPIETFLELKAVMEMPVVSEFLESVIYVDPAMEDAQIAIDRIAKFNEEGRPWYSSKYNKKRGLWSGSYGDEPFRKSSSTSTRPAVVSIAEKSHSTEHPVISNLQSDSSTTGSRSGELQKVSQQTAAIVQPDDQPFSVVEVSRPTSDVASTSVVNSAIATCSIPTPVSMPSSLVSIVKPVNASQTVTNYIPPVFSQPPPKVSPIVQIPTPVVETPSIVPQASSAPVIAPFSVQVPTFPPRSKWDTPPPVLPNFTVPPPSLVTPNLYTPNTMPMTPSMVPLIPNTSIPPPSIPPPGWPHHLG
ncbi:hypothetical protein KIN20_017534 [Parelaphostrongylus tenuis]|uniref:B30.2/SPRY domain-containing protein n=1 Tax=Parelaphostrongylus tenuis TaxID=148309 RepID=A0AAD5N6H1_PARTN|nr:hypothetical protein KIN20_017534 [Parelaphostrongylus tenuis]